MKKVVKVFCLLIIAILFVPKPAAAQTGGWYRIETDNVVFFKQPIDTDSQKLFLLEKTYYVFAYSSANEFLTVQLFDNTNGFTKISGYVKAADVVKCDQPPVAPYYPTEILNVNQSNAVLKTSPDMSAADISAALSGQEVCFYGKAWQNSDWYYVKYRTDFGYVQKRQLSDLVITPHPTPLPSETVPETPDENQTEKPAETNGSSPVEIAMILLICIPAVVIVILLFMPQKKPQQKKFQPPRPKYMSEGDTFDDLDLL